MEYVVHISVDGLKSSAITRLGQEKLPNIFKIRSEGVFTDNARTDYFATITLPNHTCMFTGRPSEDISTIAPNGKVYQGHSTIFNSDADGNIHKLNQEYVYTVFDILKGKNENGIVVNIPKTTSMYVGKSKFNFIDKSYNDNTGIKGPDGIDEIDRFVISGEFIRAQNDGNIVMNTNGVEKSVPLGTCIPIINQFLTDIQNNNITNYSFIHFNGTDRTGHHYGWDTQEYDEAIAAIDHDIGKILNALASIPKPTMLIVTADHGGGGSEPRNHGDRDHPENFTIPFYVWVNTGIQDKGTTDLYMRNPTRTSPHPSQNPQYESSEVPIRNGDVANLVLSSFGLSSIPGSFIGKDMDFLI